MSRRKVSPGLVWTTVLVAAVLAIVPLPDGWNYARPYFLAMVVIYWRIEAPEAMPLGACFASGLVLDLLVVSLLGQHALGLVIIGYIVGRFRLRIRFFPLWQQAVGVGLVLLNDRLIYVWVRALSDQGLPDWRIILPPLVGMLIWPWLFLLLDSVRRYLGQR